MTCYAINCCTSCDQSVCNQLHGMLWDSLVDASHLLGIQRLINRLTMRRGNFWGPFHKSALDHYECEMVWGLLGWVVEVHVTGSEGLNINAILQVGFQFGFFLVLWQFKILRWSGVLGHLLVRELDRYVSSRYRYISTILSATNTDTGIFILAKIWLINGTLADIQSSRYRYKTDTLFADND
jgi:hypothetical protein